MNIQKRERMNLEKALLTYGNDISFIILRDGTNIEIIDDNDDFVEEKFEENYDNYIYKEIDQNGTLRGKGLKKSLGKPLRKTVLKSSFNDQGKLRSTNNENNVIMKLTENNEYLQCANCFKFFNSKETEEESQEINISNNNNNLNQNQNKIPQNIPRQVIPPQQAYNQRYPQEQNIPRHITILSKNSFSISSKSFTISSKSFSISTKSFPISYKSSSNTKRSSKKNEYATSSAELL